MFRKSDPLPPCPYGKKCTYGQKCKFNHPERAGPHKSITERLSEHAARHLSARYSDGNNKHAVCGKSLSVPLNSNSEMNADRRTLGKYLIDIHLHRTTPKYQKFNVFLSTF